MKYLVTAALPYANGGVHIGHLAGVYIPADIYVRYLRLKGHDVKFICGSDEHGVPVTLRALKEGKTAQEIVDTYHELIKSSFQGFGISFDIYHRTSDPLHHETAASFFKHLHEKDVLLVKVGEQYYDESASMFLADRYIKGECPNCGYNEAYGDQCEQCGSSLSPFELLNPKSQLSGATPVLKQTKHWFLPLDKMQKEWLEEWILSKEGTWKKNVIGQCKSWLKEGLKPRAVTRDLDWGVKVPLEEAAGKVLYVWFDAPIGYISATKALTDDWASYWRNDDCRLIHFLGKDNIVFHTIIFPAMLRAHGGFVLPYNVPANEFLNLEGQKISTSRNWAVWLHDYIREFPGKNDELRYVLTSNMPETKDNNFYWKDRKTPETTDSYQAKVNNELVAVLGNFVNRTLVLAAKYFDNKVPLSNYHQEIINDVSAAYSTTSSHLDSFNFRQALNEVMNVARTGNKYLTDYQPWILIKTDEQGTAEVIHTCLLICGHLGLLLEPFLPESAAKIRKFLNYDMPLEWESGIVFLQPGHELGKAGLLFEKVEDLTMDKELSKLKSAEEENAKVDQQAEVQNKMAEFEDFQKLEIKTARILEAERVQGTDKLLKLLVDTGIDKRTIVSGIAESYKAEDLVGQQVSVLMNLKAKKIRGIESQGMILMAEDKNGKLSFICPDRDIDNGSVIR